MFFKPAEGILVLCVSYSISVPELLCRDIFFVTVRHIFFNAECLPLFDLLRYFVMIVSVKLSCPNVQCNFSSDTLTFNYSRAHKSSVALQAI